MMLREQIQRNGMLEVNFLNYTSYMKDGISTTADTISWSLSTQSLNKVYAAWRDPDYQAGSHLPTNLTDLDAVGDSYVPAALTFKNFEVAAQTWGSCQVPPRWEPTPRSRCARRARMQTNARAMCSANRQVPFKLALGRPSASARKKSAHTTHASSPSAQQRAPWCCFAVIL